MIRSSDVHGDLNPLTTFHRRHQSNLKSDGRRWSLRGNIRSFYHQNNVGVVSPPVPVLQVQKSTIVRRLQDCAHFHYDPTSAPVDSLARFEAKLLANGNDARQKYRSCNHRILVSNGQNEQWIVERTLDDFKFLDGYIHSCCVNRRVSKLPEVTIALTFNPDQYLRRLSLLLDARFCCSSVLNWFQIDNKAKRVDPSCDQSPVNIPAKAAATAVRSFASASADELSFEAGTMISVIDMPPPTESRRLHWSVCIGMSSSYCNVQLSQQSIPKSPGLKVKHGKIITFLRTFFSTRPSRVALKQAGIVEERVFGCDLGEHLHNTGCDVPKVVEVCCAFIERYGIVDGVYRLNGSFHNIQKLRQMFDDHQSNCVIECSGNDGYGSDIYAVGSVLKMYFRELPNPLLTYYLYDRFINLSYSHSSASANPHKRTKCINKTGFLKRIKDLVNELPPPNQRTLCFLMKHLNYLATEHSWKTNMTAKNLAIVWAPNLLKGLRGSNSQGANIADDELELIQLIALLTEQLIEHWDFIFNSEQSDDDTKFLKRYSTATDEINSLRSLTVRGGDEDGFMVALERLDAFLDTEFPRPNQSFISDLCPLMNRLSTSSSDSCKSFDDIRPSQPFSTSPLERVKHLILADRQIPSSCTAESKNQHRSPYRRYPVQQERRGSRYSLPKSSSVQQISDSTFCNDEICQHALEKGSSGGNDESDRTLSVKELLNRFEQLKVDQSRYQDR
ncbi:hypothetical protein ACOME3_010158 [Neoechinorhynchus agilis]